MWLQTNILGGEKFLDMCVGSPEIPFSERRRTFLKCTATCNLSDRFLPKFRSLSIRAELSETAGKGKALRKEDSVAQKR